MTNLSKELCEVCGIEPKRVEKRCKECDLIMEECGCFDCYKEVYPDFTQPENFVKLFNTRIPNPYITVAGFVTHFALSTLATHDFLKRLVQLLKDKSHGCIKSEIEQIKQAIRKEEWIYD